MKMVSQIDYPDSILRSRQWIYGVADVNPPTGIEWAWEPISTMFHVRARGKFDYYEDENHRPHQKWVKTRSELEELCTLLSHCDEFSIHVRQNRGTSLLPFITTIQVGTWNDGDYLIQALELHRHIKPILGPILEDARILKIFCSVRKQVLELQRDFSIYPRGCADVFEFGKVISGDFFPVNFKELCNVFAPHVFPFIEAPPQNVFVRPGQRLNPRWYNFLTHQTHLLLRIFNHVKDKMTHTQMEVGFNWSRHASNRMINAEEFGLPKNVIDLAVSVLTNVRLEAHATKNWPLYKRIADLKPTSDRRFVPYLLDLVTWRQDASMNYNIIPELIFSDSNLFELSENPQKSEDWIKNNIRNLGTNHTQYRIVKRIVDAQVPGTVMADVHRILCRNCYTPGNPAKFCVYPPSARSGAFQAFLHKRENVFLRNQYLRQNARFISQAVHDFNKALVKAGEE